MQEQPLLGKRAWFATEQGYLMSVANRGYKWDSKSIVAAHYDIFSNSNIEACFDIKNCKTGHGIYAIKGGINSIDDILSILLPQSAYIYNNFRSLRNACSVIHDILPSIIFGNVALHGDIVEGEIGFRASEATILEVVSVKIDHIPPAWKKYVFNTDETILEKIHHNYNVPILIL